MDSELFRMLGLTENEKNIYSALLKMGSMSILDISKYTNLNRTFCYDVVERMIEKGLLLQSLGSRKVYQSVSPEQLGVLIEKAYLDSRKELEDLKSIKKSEERNTEILEFRGYYAVFNLFRRLISQDTEVLSFWSTKVGQLYQEFMEANVKLRINQKIPLRVLTDENDWTKKWLKALTFDNNYRQVKYLKDFDFESTIYMFNNEVAIITYENNIPYGLLIKNKENYETQKKIFNKMWEDN